MQEFLQNDNIFNPNKGNFTWDNVKKLLSWTKFRAIQSRSFDHVQSTKPYIQQTKQMLISKTGNFFCCNSESLSLYLVQCLAYISNFNGKLPFYTASKNDKAFYFLTFFEVKTQVQYLHILPVHINRFFDQWMLDNQDNAYSCWGKSQKKKNSKKEHENGQLPLNHTNKNQ